ncbi:MAG: DUF433 domain-containing protein [Vicinamibacterales bacterium]
MLIPFVPRVSMKKPDPREIPLYNLTEAARWVGVPPSTLRKWMYGRTYPAAGTVRRSEPLFQPADPERGRLSFANIAEAHILDATRKHRIPMADVRAAIDLVLSERRSEHPLLTGRFFRYGKRLFVEYLNEKVAAYAPNVGQRPLGDLLDRYLERIERDNKDRPIALFPMRYNESRRVVLDFNVSGGQPVVAGTGILVEHLRDLQKAGVSIDKIAYQVQPGRVHRCRSDQIHRRRVTIRTGVHRCSLTPRTAHGSLPKSFMPPIGESNSTPSISENAATFQTTNGSPTR